MSLAKVSSNKVFGGHHEKYLHDSDVLNCQMRFAIFLPPQAEKQSVPVVYWLSGLTCTDENFMQKSSAQRIAAELGIALVAPDTSPRGEGVADDPDGAYDLGLGAGFYLNATEPPWNQHYRMYDYVVSELPSLIEAHFPVTSKRSISGHSMGGHGALVIGMRNPERYSSISAFSPISNPVNCPWGQKALENYLGDDKEAWLKYDATELMLSSVSHVPALIDQGSEDQFLQDQLHPGALKSAAEQVSFPLELRTQEGYDHSYYFISTFIEDHLKFHYQYLMEK